jgi:parallel beta helix pectate lyase-like protein
MLALLRKSVLLVLTAAALSSVAVGQNNRSAVSVAGNDAATCTPADPCRTFAVALSRTNPNGDVVALTSGGYGPFTVDKPATIVAAPGIYAAVVATAGDAIHINAGAGAKVVIRGLHLYGMQTGANGISATGSSEEVHVENCVIDGFSQCCGLAGIRASLNVRVSDTTIRNGRVGILIASDSVVKGTINRVQVRDMFIGIEAGANANVTVRDSVAADCSGGFRAVGGTGQLNIQNSLATNNTTGVEALNGGTVRVSNTMATDNATGFLNTSSTFVSWGNNKVLGNTTQTSGTITVVTQD